MECWYGCFQNDAGTAGSYSDAIIAVVATLLVLGIAVPEDHRFSEEAYFRFSPRCDTT